MRGKMQLELTAELKENLIRAIKSGKVQVFFDEKWAYPNDDTIGQSDFVKRVIGGDQKTIPFLDVMFKTEKKGGYIIHIQTEDLTNGKTSS